VGSDDGLPVVLVGLLVLRLLPPKNVQDRSDLAEMLDRAGEVEHEVVAHLVARLDEAFSTEPVHEYVLEVLHDLTDQLEDDDELQDITEVAVLVVNFPVDLRILFQLFNAGLEAKRHSEIDQEGE